VRDSEVLQRMILVLITHARAFGQAEDGGSGGVDLPWWALLRW
jgi:hypothetical protein